MASRFHGRRPAVRSQRRLTSWALGPGTDATGGEQGVSVVGNTLWGLGVAPAEDGLTVVRVHGFMEIRLPVITSAGDGFSGAVGITIVDDRAFAAGVASIPRPFTDRFDNDWMWHKLWSIHPEGTTIELNSSFSLQIDIDTKSMRKLPVGQTMCGVFEVASEVGTASVGFYASTRVLVKLP